MIAEPSAPHHLDSGLLYVPSAATRNPRPGDAVYYDVTQNALRSPQSAAESLLVCGILSYRQDQVANADSIVEFLDGAEVQIGDFGTFWVVAGGAVEYGQIISWDRADFKWDAAARVRPLRPLFRIQLFAPRALRAWTRPVVKARHRLRSGYLSNSPACARTKTSRR